MKVIALAILREDSTIEDEEVPDWATVTQAPSWVQRLVFVDLPANPDEWHSLFAEYELSCILLTQEMLEEEEEERAAKAAQLFQMMGRGWHGWKLVAEVNTYAAHLGTEANKYGQWTQGQDPARVAIDLTGM